MPLERLQAQSFQEWRDSRYESLHGQRLLHDVALGERGTIKSKSDEV